MPSTVTITQELKTLTVDPRFAPHAVSNMGRRICAYVFTAVKKEMQKVWQVLIASA